MLDKSLYKIPKEPEEVKILTSNQKVYGKLVEVEFTDSVLSARQIRKNEKSKEKGNGVIQLGLGGKTVSFIVRASRNNKKIKIGHLIKVEYHWVKRKTVEKWAKSTKKLRPELLFHPSRVNDLGFVVRPITIESSRDEPNLKGNIWDEV